MEACATDDVMTLSGSKHPCAGTHLEGQVGVLMHAEDLWVVDERQVLDVALVVREAVRVQSKVDPCSEQ